jgi:hypothetical protein
MGRPGELHKLTIKLEILARDRSADAGLAAESQA